MGGHKLTRRDLALGFADLGFTRGAEIGIERGLFSQVLCESIPGLVLVAVDAWESRQGYREHVAPELWKRIETDARERLRPYCVLVVKGKSTDVARGIPDGSLDFVFVDAEHNEKAVRSDLAAWVPKVRKGGIVSGHDFNLPEVEKVVRETAESRVLLTQEKSPSWWWVRP